MSTECAVIAIGEKTKNFGNPTTKTGISAKESTDHRGGPIDDDASAKTGGFTTGPFSNISEAFTTKGLNGTTVTDIDEIKE